MKKLILANKQDEKIGEEEKLKCHLGEGILHRAFTIFVFNKKGKLLLQQRSENKFLWPGFWETSCSSHPYFGENLVQAAEKRLQEELGFSTQLKIVDKFYYQAKYKDIGSEHEICYLLVGNYDGEIKPNKKEVQDFKWVDLKLLKQDIKSHPIEYAPWLILTLEKFYDS